MGRYYWLILISLVSGSILNAQKEDVNWVFGIGCGINFENPEDPVIFLSNAENFEASASISDTSGQLQFYLAKDVLLNRFNDTLLNGAEINISGTYAGGIVIVPFSKASQLYHLFHVGQVDHVGLEWGYERLYHSVVDMTMDNGRGGVLTKNELLLDEVLNEGISVVKHADGVSWWLILHENVEIAGADCTNTFFKYLIQGAFISGPFTQDIGTPDCISDYPGGRTKFFSTGDRMIYMDYADVSTELFDFDRCSGELSNPVSLGKNVPAYGAETSPDGRYLYLADILGHNLLFQYDLLATNIPASLQIIEANPNGFDGIRQMLLAPNGKIYISSEVGFTFPQYISVITHPNLPGAECGYEPFSFYLGEDAFTLGDLPNMPNYNLGAMDGEPCITAIEHLEETGSGLRIYPNPASDYLHMDNIAGFDYVIIYDLFGKQVTSANILNEDEIVDITGLYNGMYTIVFHVKGGLLRAERFVKLGY